LGGKDVPSNIISLCANCHRSVHWLASGDRSICPHAYGLGANVRVRRQLLALARRIRRRRLKVIGPDRHSKVALPLTMVFEAIITRNGLERDEAKLMKQYLRKAWRSIKEGDRKLCSVYVVRNARFLTVNANNYLAIRVPAWNDYGLRENTNIVLIWPLGTRPSSMSAARFRRVSGGRFSRIPCTNLWLTWDECLALSTGDWRAFGEAVHTALTHVKTQRRVSNVLMSE
jgi:hypothetical protein